MSSRSVSEVLNCPRESKARQMVSAGGTMGIIETRPFGPINRMYGLGPPMHRRILVKLERFLRLSRELGR